MDASEHAMQIRFLMSVRDSVTLWHLRCRMREALLDFVQRDYSQHLSTVRARLTGTPTADSDIL